jgi:hypothetical protein
MTLEDIIVVATIEVTPQTVVVHVNGLDKVLALRSRVEFPLAHVTNVAYDPSETQRELEQFWQETHIFGANAPGSTMVGDYTEHGDRIFWDMHHPERAITLQLIQEKYAKVIVEVADPEATLRSLQDALRQRPLVSAA